MKHKSSRNATLDALKGIAIILVVLGHCIQFGSGSSFLDSKSFFDNTIFKIIYSFHMPLFMLISGYLFHFSIEKHSFGENITIRIKNLIIPIITWQTIWLLIIEFDSLTDFCASYYFYTYLNTLWFLTSVFINSIIVLIYNKYFNDSILLYSITFIILLFIPNLHSYNLYVYMFPYFVCAYLFNKTGGFKKLNSKWKYFSGGGLIIIYLFLLSHYETTDYAYTSGTYILKNHMLSISQISTDIFRWSIGLIGSICIIIIIDYISGKIKQSFLIKGLCRIGTKTMGVYIISTYLFKCFYLLPISELSYTYIIIESIITICISLLAIWLIEQNKYLKIVLLGGR